MFFLFFVTHMTAYEMRISDWSPDVCSSDLVDLFVDGSHVVADAASGDLRTGQRSAMERDGTIIVTQAGDRKSGVSGKSVSVRVDLGGRRLIKKRNNNLNHLYSYDA